jgi:hypothetical protein
MRHELYGSALTDAEKKLWDVTTLEPGDTPEKIRSKIAMRQQIVSNQYTSRYNNYTQGFNPNDPSGLNPVGAPKTAPTVTSHPSVKPALGGSASGLPVMKSIDEALKLPPGTKFIDADGVPRVR